MKASDLEAKYGINLNLNGDWDWIIYVFNKNAFMASHKIVSIKSFKNKEECLKEVEDTFNMYGFEKMNRGV